MRNLTMLGRSLLLAVASQMVMAQTTAPTLSSSSTTAAPATATQPTDKLVADYSAWAGSDANAASMVTGLRTGKDITLTGTAIDGSVTTTTFNPTTKPMGYGNIKIALSLARTQLASQGITNPTTAQLQGALVGDGGQQGILQMRASGMGWGQIANSLGVKLGSVVSGKVPTNAATVATTTTTGGSITTAGGKSSRGGIVTAEGNSAGGAATTGHGKGITTAAGASASGGATAGMGQGNAYGRGGIVSAAGGSAGGGNAYGKGGKP
jgi:hypothetical protein